jgi:hypothetical protein
MVSRNSKFPFAAVLIVCPLLAIIVLGLVKYHSDTVYASSHPSQSVMDAYNHGYVMGGKQQAMIDYAHFNHLGPLPKTVINGHHDPNLRDLYFDFKQAAAGDPYYQSSIFSQHPFPSEALIAIAGSMGEGNGETNQKAKRNTTAKRTDRDARDVSGLQSKVVGVQSDHGRGKSPTSIAISRTP